MYSVHRVKSVFKKSKKPKGDNSVHFECFWETLYLKKL